MALDRVFVPIKIGDNGEYLDSMILGYIDERAWGLPFEKIVVPDSLGSKVYRYAQVDRVLIPKLQQLQAPVGFLKTLGLMGEQLPDPATHKIIGGVLPIADVAAYAKVDVADLRNQSEGKAPFNLVGVDLLKDIRAYTPDGKIVDLRTINGGSYTVGAGGSYATWVLFGADCTTLIAALTGTQISNITETAQTVIDIALAGLSLNLTSNIDPLGNFGAGWLITTAFASNGVGLFHITCTSASAGATININKLSFKHTASDSNWTGSVRILSNTLNIFNNISNCLFDANNQRIICVSQNAASNVLKIYNSVAANGNRTGGGWCAGFGPTVGHANSIYENLTVLNMIGGTAEQGGAFGITNYANIAATFKNIACFGNSKDYQYGTDPSTGNGLGNGVASKCASSDTTGSEAGLRSLVAANEFKSLDITSANFLKLKKLTLDSNGVVPSIAANTYGIRGNARPHGGLYSIGADEFKGVGGFPYAMFMKGA